MESDRDIISSFDSISELIILFDSPALDGPCTSHQLVWKKEVEAWGFESRKVAMEIRIGWFKGSFCVCRLRVQQGYEGENPLEYLFLISRIESSKILVRDS